MIERIAEHEPIVRMVEWFQEVFVFSHQNFPTEHLRSRNKQLRFPTAQARSAALAVKRLRESLIHLWIQKSCHLWGCNGWTPISWPPILGSHGFPKVSRFSLVQPSASSLKSSLPQNAAMGRARCLAPLAMALGMAFVMPLCFSWMPQGAQGPQGQGQGQKSPRSKVSRQIQANDASDFHAMDPNYLVKEFSAMTKTAFRRRMALRKPLPERLALFFPAIEGREGRAAEPSTHWEKMAAKYVVPFNIV